MGRRRSASGSTRVLQGLFALAWVGFLIYMLSGYLRKTKDETVAGEEITPPAETVPEGQTTVPAVTTLPASTLAENTKPIPEITNGSGADAGPTAGNILANTIAVYRNANAYSDQGRLQLAYQINGSRFQEEYPWQTAWNQDGRLSADIFDTKVRSDGTFLSCFVSEVRTENLKNQQLFLRGSRLVQELYSDKIATYYLNGGERIPVNETIVPDGKLLVPPAIALLTGQFESPWLDSSVEPRRLKDTQIDGKPCYVISCPSRNGELVAWIDQTSSLIRQVRLPNNLLDPMLASDPDVKELNLFAKFSGASFTASPLAFEKVTPKPGVWPVREFVAPADALPTNLLGEMAPEFLLLDQQGAKVTDRQLSGKPIAMLWLDGGENDLELVKDFDAIQKTIGSNGINFAVVVGPNSTERSPTGTWGLLPSIQPAANRTKIPFLLDSDGNESKNLELESLPAIVVLDSNLNIQFADLLAKPSGYNGKLAISKQWTQRLTGAIVATQKGVNVADDMRAKYRNYLEQYFKDRDQRLVASYFPEFSLPQQTKTTAVAVKVRQQQTAQRSKRKLNPRLVWESTRLQSPGNIALIPDGRGGTQGLLILDGWQTVSLFGVDGNAINQKRLDLPAGAAVTAIRPMSSDVGDQCFAMYSVGGKQVFVFDGKMQLVGTFPESAEAVAPVLACEVIPGTRGKDDQLLVCFGDSGGGMMYDPFTKKSRSAGPTAVRSLALTGRSVIAVNDRTGALLSMDDGRVIDDDREYVHVENGADGQTVFAATAMNASQEWSLVGIDSSLQEKWSFPIESTMFDNGIEPISGVSATRGTGTWAVADSSNRIYLISDIGTWLGDVAADGNVRGLKLMSVGGRTRLIVSTDKKIECWELNFAPERVGAMSGRVE